MSRFVRSRNVPVGGANADFHFRGEHDYLRIIEYARDMDRNDPIVGPAIDKTVTQVVRDGFAFDPNSGDARLDALLKEKMHKWATTPELCDVSKERMFVDLERMVLRHTLVDGDVFGMPVEDQNDPRHGAIELIEGHRCRTPKNTKLDVVLGVKLDRLTRERLQYWFTRDNVGPLNSVDRVSDMRKHDARDAAGDRNIFHVYDPQRVSQTRGVSRFAAAFMTLGMLDDIQLATMVKQQAVSSYAIFLKRAQARNTFQPGPNGVDPRHAGGSGTGVGVDRNSGMLKRIGPGMILEGEPGDELSGFSPNIPGESYFAHVRQMMQIFGLHLRLPLVLLLMDAAETNFSGWRGAVDEARREFGVMQQWLKRRWHVPVTNWKIQHWLDVDRDVRRLYREVRGENVDPFRFQWNAPTWSYVQPLDDAKAHDFRRQTLQTSPRRGAAELGVDHETIVAEAIEDNSSAIRAALKAHREIKQDFPDANLDWREILHLDVSSQATSSLLRSGVGGAALASGQEPDDREEDDAREESDQRFRSEESSAEEVLQNA